MPVIMPGPQKNTTVNISRTLKPGNMQHPETIIAIVETPKGCSQKFEFMAETKSFKLSKILPAGMVFPFDFGMIPDTKGEDGDPLDIIIVSESGTFTGCYIECRIIGALKAEQTERDGKTMRNDRLMGVPI